MQRDLHTTDNSPLHGLQYKDRNQFIEVDHELIPRSLIQSLLGAIALLRVRFPRPKRLKGDKRARRKDPLYTVEEVSVHEAEQQRDFNARRSRRRVTMGVTSSPFAPLSSSDDSGGEDDTGHSSNDTLSGTSSDSSSTDDSDTSLDAGAACYAACR